MCVGESLFWVVSVCRFISFCHVSNRIVANKRRRIHLQLTESQNNAKIDNVNKILKEWHTYLKQKKSILCIWQTTENKKNRTKEPTKADSIPKNVSKHDGKTRQWKKRAKTLSLCCTKPKIRTHRNLIRQQNAMAKKTWCEKLYGKEIPTKLER